VTVVPDDRGGLQFATPGQRHPFPPARRHGAAIDRRRCRTPPHASSIRRYSSPPWAAIAPSDLYSNIHDLACWCLTRRTRQTIVCGDAAHAWLTFAPLSHGAKSAGMRVAANCRHSGIDVRQVAGNPLADAEVGVVSRSPGSQYVSESGNWSPSGLYPSGSAAGLAGDTMFVMQRNVAHAALQAFVGAGWLV
jgi:hypothetical protein